MVTYIYLQKTVGFWCCHRNWDSYSSPAFNSEWQWRSCQHCFNLWKECQPKHVSKPLAAHCSFSWLVSRSHLHCKSEKGLFHFTSLVGTLHERYLCDWIKPSRLTFKTNICKNWLEKRKEYKNQFRMNFFTFINYIYLFILCYLSFCYGPPGNNINMLLSAKFTRKV